jgi:hypothetical protein
MPWIPSSNGVGGGGGPWVGDGWTRETVSVPDGGSFDPGQDVWNNNNYILFESGGLAQDVILTGPTASAGMWIVKNATIYTMTFSGVALKGNQLAIFHVDETDGNSIAVIAWPNARDVSVWTTSTLLNPPIGYPHTYDAVRLVDTTAAAVSVIPGDQWRNGDTFTVKHIAGASNCVFAPAGGATVMQDDGTQAASYTFNSIGMSITFVYYLTGNYWVAV